MIKVVSGGEQWQYYSIQYHSKGLTLRSVFCSETHISKRCHTERTGKAVVQTAVQTHPAIGVPTRCGDRLPQGAAT